MTPLYTYYETAMDQFNNINNNDNEKAELSCIKEAKGGTLNLLHIIS